MDKTEIVAIGIVMPMILLIVLGFAYITRRKKNAHKHFIKCNIEYISESLGASVQYVEKGKLPFHIVGEDPTLHAKYANSCLCQDMLTGKYRGNEFVITNMQTTHSQGYGNLSYSIFSGVYILMSVPNKQINPLYAYSYDFWKDFNVKNNAKLTFNVAGERLYENNEYSDFPNFKLILTKEHWKKIRVDQSLAVSLEAFFHNINDQVSLFIYPDGKLGFAIRNFQYLKHNHLIREDVETIKYYLEKLNTCLSSFQS